MKTRQQEREEQRNAVKQNKKLVSSIQELMKLHENLAKEYNKAVTQNSILVDKIVELGLSPQEVINEGFTKMQSKTSPEPISEIQVISDTNTQPSQE